MSEASAEAPRPRVTSMRVLMLLLCSASGIAITSISGVTYGDRMSSSQGFWRVSVRDDLPLSLAPLRPHRTFVVVWDGLGHLEAQEMRSVEMLRSNGQCRVTDVGPLPVSRPVYAVLSTGLEQDRTGVRGNDHGAPIETPSIWEAARQRGLTVSAISELTWWRELFPRGFDRYRTPTRDEDFFRLPIESDLTLIHPLYIDESGHEFGAASVEYRETVRRADREMQELLATVDMQRDLLIMTADHGHTLRGGHGGTQDRVARVLTCIAGRGVQRDAQQGRMQATSVAPLLALYLGLPFPPEMRAGEDDDLDVLFEIVDRQVYSEEYLENRVRAVERFRSVNRERLLSWDPDSGGSWERFRSSAQRDQLHRAMPCLLLIFVVLIATGRATRQPMRSLLFLLGFAIASVGLQILVRGSFDLSSVASRGDFLRSTISMALVITAMFVALHLGRFRDLGSLLLDLTALCAVSTLLSLAHLFAFGFQVGYPVPPSALYFFPYWAALVFGSVYAVSIGVASYAFVELRRESLAAPNERLANG